MFVRYRTAYYRSEHHHSHRAPNRPYRFPFYSRENDEPPHIHVARDALETKFWLQPVSLVANVGFGPRSIAKLCSPPTFGSMESKPPTPVTAVRCWIEGRRVWLELSDQRMLSFPVTKFPLLAQATPEELAQVSLRLQGRALRWESLDEDIWVEDVVAGRFPRPAQTIPV